MMGNYHVRFGGRERRVLIEARPSRPNAEIGAGLCCADLGLPNVLHDSHASYVGHWLGILRGDKTAIIHAAAKAEQAFAYLKSFGSAAAEGECHEDDAPAPALAA